MIKDMVKGIIKDMVKDILKDMAEDIVKDMVEDIVKDMVEGIAMVVHMVQDMVLLPMVHRNPGDTKDIPKCSSLGTGMVNRGPPNIPFHKMYNSISSKSSTPNKYYLILTQNKSLPRFQLHQSNSSIPIDI
ncbi:hypothetical protein DSO57_1017760 [Entomophthora muscae]|uniref:Uncharacterized protein n=1 Tax=Entomophthora muscae TaxID=34485 RepID=A0ACC2RJ86_9FUNG|nr:hypothetical protein DSO57_1017760 [Entomophthora muscae]